MYNYNKDLIYFIKREGTTQNPYNNITENIHVLYEKAFLEEIPVKSFKVIAKVGNTTLTEVLRQQDIKTTNQYYVDYKQGIVYFHSTKNSVLVTLTYRGQGVLLYPASRIYVDSAVGAKDIVRTLRDLIVEGVGALDAIRDVAIIIDRAESAVGSIETAVINSSNAIALINSKITEINTAEASRLSSENTRRSNETSRVNAEIARVSAETTRGTNETARVNAEILRQSQEAQRQTSSQTAITNINIAKTNAENATSQALSASNAINASIAEARSMIDNMSFKEAFNISSSYVKNNIVSYNGSSYIAKTNTVGNIPTNQNYWGLLAQRGIDGTGSVSSVNNISPNLNGNVTITSEDIDVYSKSQIDSIVSNVNTNVNSKIPNSEKGVAGGVAKLNASGKVVDASGNEVEGKVTSVNGKIGDITGLETVDGVNSKINDHSNSGLNKHVEVLGFRPTTLDKRGVLFIVKGAQNDIQESIDGGLLTTPYDGWGIDAGFFGESYDEDIDGGEFAPKPIIEIRDIDAGIFMTPDDGESVDAGLFTLLDDNESIDGGMF